jgi:hypothetical protein
MLTACGYSITEEALIERFWRISDAETRNIIEQEWAACYAARVGEMVESGFRQSLAPMDGVTELLARAQIQSPELFDRRNAARRREDAPVASLMFRRRMRFETIPALTGRSPDKF